MQYETLYAYRSYQIFGRNAQTGARRKGGKGRKTRKKKEISLRGHRCRWAGLHESHSDQTTPRGKGFVQNIV